MSLVGMTNRNGDRGTLRYAAPATRLTPRGRVTRPS
jgi:hypothetical protein